MRQSRRRRDGRAVDADALRAKPHRRLHGALHGAAERDAALELLGDRFGDQLRIEFRLADFEDVDDDVAIGELGHHLAQLLDVGALLADHHAGRAEWIVTRHFLCGRSITIFDTAACFKASDRSSRIFMSSCKSLP